MPTKIHPNGSAQLQLDRNQEKPLRVRVSCPGCGVRLKVKQQVVGKRIQCPKPTCRTSFVVLSPSSRSARKPSAANSNILGWCLVAGVFLVAVVAVGYWAVTRNNPQTVASVSPLETEPGVGPSTVLNGGSGSGQENNKTPELFEPIPIKTGNDNTQPVKISDKGEPKKTNNIGNAKPALIDQKKNKPAQNRPPVVSIAQSFPSQPTAGDTLVISLCNSDPDGDSVSLKYRLNSANKWLQVAKTKISPPAFAVTAIGLLGSQCGQGHFAVPALVHEKNHTQIKLGKLPPGPVKLEVQAVDGRDSQSQILSKVWKVAQYKVGEIRRFTGHTGGVSWVAVSKDGKSVISCSGGATVKYDPNGPLSTVGRRERMTLSFAPNNDGTVRVWDFDSGKIRKVINASNAKFSRFLRTVKFTKDDRHVFSVGYNHLKLLDWQTGNTVRTIETKCQTGDVSISEKYVVSSYKNTVQLWRLDTGEKIRAFHAGFGKITSTVFSSDEKYLLCSAGKNIYLWNIETGAKVKTFRDDSELVWSVSFSPDGKKIASGSTDGTIRIWDIETGKAIRKLSGHKNGVLCVAFSPDGQRLLSSSGTGKYKNKVTTAAELGRLLGEVGLTGNTGGGEKVMFTDCTVRLWDTETGKQLHCFEGHTSYIPCVCFSQDGQFALSASNDRTIRLWKLP